LNLGPIFTKNADVSKKTVDFAKKLHIKG